MFIEDGFRKENENYVKRTVVGATLLDSLWETHTIKGYAFFKTDVRDFTKDFAMPEGLNYETIGYEGMQALLKQALDSVPKEYARLFGERDEDGNWKNAKYEKEYMGSETYDKQYYRYDEATKQKVAYTVEKTRSIPAVETLNYDSYVTYQKALEALTDDERDEKGQNERVVVKGNGLFTEWVGYAPVMKPGADPDVDVEDYRENVRFAGFGETGRIMGMFIQHKTIEGAGWAECEQPAYSRRLWDDRGSWMKAPNIRSVVDIAMTVTAGVIAPGAGALVLNTVLNTLDDAVFTMLDIANGMDPLAAAEGLVKKAATSYVTGRISFGFADGGGLLNSQMLGKGVIGETLTKGLQIGMTNVTSSAVNAFSVTNALNGGSLFDTDAFMEGAFGKSAMVGVFSGMAGQAVTGVLGKVDLTDANKTLLNGHTFKTGSLENFNAFMGSMAGSAVTYGMTGNATFNLARLKGVGLMEMHLGKDGFQMNLGMNGTDVSLGTVARAAQGASEAMKVIDWKYGTLEERATLNGINVMGWTGEQGNDFNVALSKAIWERKAKVRYEKMAGNGYHDQGTNTVAISSEFLGSGLDAAAKLATVMSHEGTHLAGNRVEGVAHKQGNLTYNQITTMFGLTADTAFSQSMVDAINNPASWKENVGTRDNWEKMTNAQGETFYKMDGRKGIYENGKLVGSTDPVADKRIKELNSMLFCSGDQKLQTKARDELDAYASADTVDKRQSIASESVAALYAAAHNGKQPTSEDLTAFLDEQVARNDRWRGEAWVTRGMLTQLREGMSGPIDMGTLWSAGLLDAMSGNGIFRETSSNPRAGIDNMRVKEGLEDTGADVTTMDIDKAIEYLDRNYEHDGFTKYRNGEVTAMALQNLYASEIGLFVGMSQDYLRLEKILSAQQDILKVEKASSKEGTSLAIYDPKFAARQMGLDPEHFAGLPLLRQEYVTKVVSLQYKVAEMRAAGMTSEQIARTLSAERRAIGIEYKGLSPDAELQRFYARNRVLYGGDPLGPTVDWLRRQEKSWDQIIESASRPGGRDLGY